MSPPEAESPNVSVVTVRCRHKMVVPVPVCFSVLSVFPRSRPRACAGLTVLLIPWYAISVPAGPRAMIPVFFCACFSFTQCFACSLVPLLVSIQAARCSLFPHVCSRTRVVVCVCVFYFSIFSRARLFPDWPMSATASL